MPFEHLSQGTSAGGYSLFIKDGKLRYVHNYVGRAVYGVESDQVLAPGKHIGSRIGTAAPSLNSSNGGSRARGGAGPAGHSVAGARFPPSGPIRSSQLWQIDAAWPTGLPRSPLEPDKFMDRGGVSLVAQDLTVRGHRGPGRTRPRRFGDGNHR